MRLTEIEVVERIERITLRRLRLCVRRGWVSPRTAEQGPVYDDVDLARLRLVDELKELNINDDAIPVVLSLIDQLHGVRCELRALAEAVDEQPEGVRDRIGRLFAERAGGS